MNRLIWTLRMTVPAFAVFILTGLQGNAVVFSTDFATESAFTDNFRVTAGGNHFSWQEPGVVQARQQGANFFGVALYDTDPGSAGLTNTGFLTEGLQARVAWNTLINSPNFSFFTRVQSDTGRGVLARVIFTSTTNVRFQLFYNAQIGGNPGTGATNFFDWEYSVTTGGGGFYRTGTSGGSGTSGHILGTGEFYGITLEQTESSFRLSVHTPEGNLMATTGFQTPAVAYDSPGAVGFATAAGGSGTETIQIDSFGVIPEPAHGAAVASLFFGVAAVWWRRRLK